jgi:hypothetical protein
MVALAALIVGIFYFNVIRAKRAVNFEVIGEGGERYVCTKLIALIR